MSELQIALLLIAGAVLAGLYLAGKWQERRLLRRLGEELGGGVGDALLGEPGAGRSEASASGMQRRIEPQLRPDPRAGQAAAAAGAAAAARAAPAQAAAGAAARRSEWIEDPMLDCVLELRCAR